MEYAKYLGMDLKKDKKYFSIAREGLKAPLPEKWKPYKNSKGDIYYINMETNQSVYEHPCDEHYRKLFQETKAKDNLSEKAKKNLKIVIKNNQKPEFFSQKLTKMRSDDSFNQFKMLNDSFSDNSAKLTEKSNQGDLEIVSEMELGQIDQEINNKLIGYKKMKEKAFEEYMKNLEKLKMEKEKAVTMNNETKIKELQAEFKKLEEKLQNEKKQIEENVFLGCQIKIQQKMKHENEKFNLLRKKLESRLKNNNKEELKNYEENLKNEINQKKSKISIVKNEEEKNQVMKKKIHENKKKLLLNKMNEELKKELEKENLENLTKFQEVENNKKKQKLNEILMNLENDERETHYVKYKKIQFFVKFFVRKYKKKKMRKKTKIW